MNPDFYRLLKSCGLVREDWVGWGMAKKKNHRKSSVSFRWAKWDYRWNAAYFITIVTKNRERFFGHIHAGKMHLSTIGILADEFWLEIPNHFDFARLGPHVIMPDHMHGIVIIDKPEDYWIPIASRARPVQRRFGKPEAKSLSSILGSYKSVVSKNAHSVDPAFAWQSRFHDHVIRDQRAFDNISRYIRDNPKNWKA